MQTAFLFAFLVAHVAVQQSRASPTFGNEYVHIKLHVPKEAAANAQHNVRHLETVANTPAPISTTVYHAQPVAPKVIHHYHRRRRPSKTAAAAKGHHKSLVESIVVAEVKRPEHTNHLDYLSHAEEIAEHIIKPVVPQYRGPKIKSVDTYKVVEETPYRKPHEHVETFKVVESGGKEAAPHRQQHVETYKIVDSKEPAPSYHRDEYKHEPTFKVIEEDYHHYGRETRKPAAQVETVHLVESSRGSKPYAKDSERSHVVIEETTHHHVPHTKEVFTYADLPLYDHGEEERFLSGGEYLYESAPKKTEYHHEKPLKYEYLSERPSKPVKVVETFEPQTPSQLYKPVHHKTLTYESIYKPTEYISKPSYETAFKPSEYISNPSVSHHYQDGDLGPKIIERPELSSSYALHRELLPPHIQEPAPVTEEPDDFFERMKYPHNHSLTYRQGEGQRYTKTTSTKHATTTDYVNKYVPPPSGGGGGEFPSHEWRPELQSNQPAETYTGHDSYSANHVQGLGSGGYKYPLPYP